MNTKASAATNSKIVRLRRTLQTSFSEIPAPVACVPGSTLPQIPQATAPDSAMPPNTLNVLCQPNAFESGTATETESATPKLNAAISRPFMMVISLGRNHCISSGPVAGNMAPEPTP